MPHDPDLERFFQDLREAQGAEDAAAHAPVPASPLEPMQIVLLPEPDGDIIAKIEGLGVFHLDPGGAVSFHYDHEPEQRWQVNRSMTAFLESVQVFNQCGQDACRLFNEDENAEPEAPWVLERLRTELGKIEPLGDPQTSLWSATVEDADGGLCRLF